jgi:protein N-terminal methyltransferase
MGGWQWALGDDQSKGVGLTFISTEEKFKALFKEAGLKIMRTEIQRGMPKELYTVRMWALQPAT